MSLSANPRPFVLRVIFVGMALVLITRLFFLQLFEDKYKVMAADIAIYRKIVYPPRGVITDRKGVQLCTNDLIYDLTVTAAEVPKNFDSSRLCAILGIDGSFYRSQFERAKAMNGPKRPGTFVAQLSPAQTARMQESPDAFPGFQLLERNIRRYGEPIAAGILGYIAEVSPEQLKRTRFASYNQGDYVGKDGLELTYEEVLRGQRGVHYFEKDNYNRPRDHYLKGALDTPEVAGSQMQLYLDAALQAYGEKLMGNKLGSIVAIDPKTGGILAMVSSPSYDPNLLRGADRSKNYSALQQLATKPMFNRAMKAFYNPGSTQKPMTALIALDEGAITPASGYPCHGAYMACGRRIACTESWAGHAANLRLALAHSCNAFFCNTYRLSVDLPKFGGVKRGLEEWYRHMYSLGFGHPTGVDLPFEIGGTLFDTVQYNKMYKGSWNSCTNVYIGMGQGELAVTPIQMANGMCIIANHGYYYLPHLVKSIGRDSAHATLKPYLERHVPIHIPDTVYQTVGLGMMDVVQEGTGRVAQIPGVEVCAKTGTVENYALINGTRTKMQNHSMFVAFAPRINPRIAIAVTVENAGFGATWAGPIASLMIEKYLFDSIATKRKPLEEKMLKGNVINMRLVKIIDSTQRAKDFERWNQRMMEDRLVNAVARQEDSMKFVNWVNKYVMRKSR